MSRIYLERFKSTQIYLIAQEATNDRLILRLASSSTFSYDLSRCDARAAVNTSAGAESLVLCISRSRQSTCGTWF